MFKKGERVRVREWDDMADENEVWGEDIEFDGDYLMFTADMKYLCGQELEVEKDGPTITVGQGTTEWELTESMVIRLTDTKEENKMEPEFSNYTIETIKEIWDNHTNECIEIRPDRDRLNLIEIKYKDSRGVVQASISMDVEHAKLVSKALQQILEDYFMAKLYY